MRLMPPRGSRAPSPIVRPGGGSGGATGARAPRLATAVALALALLVPALAHADLKSADGKFVHGDYVGAIREYREVKGKDARLAALRLGRALLRTGDLAGAEKAARVAAADARLAADASVLLSELLRAQGKHPEARALLEETTRKHPKHLRARCQLGLVYRDLGQMKEAEKVFDRFFEDYNSGAIDTKRAEDLMYVAIAARYLEAFKDASDTFQDAVDLDPTLTEANVEWGYLFLEKYAAGEAERSFDDVFKLDPHHPDAHAGMARVKIEQGYDVRAALAHVGKALAVNRRHPDALAVRAELEIDNEQYADAEKTLREILATNPNDLTARSMLAAVRWLTDDKAGYEAERQRVLAINPRYARFYHLVADFAVKEHRYREAIKLEEEALKLDPKYHLALAGIGIGYLRLGEEKKGLEHLNKAFERDPFNVRAFNILNLFEDDIAKDYVFTSSRNFKIRVAKGELKLVERYVPQLLERAHADMARRYGLTPGPITIELFRDPDQYSVRTVGLPNLGALGVCFGQVITALSPANRNINWGMVLWHELAHVFAIQLSGSRVPRWFTEGLSEYETLIARPEWRRENDADVYAALEKGTLPSIANLNTMFTRATDMQEMVVAYHLSSVAIEFIVSRWGFPKVVEALRLFGKGKETPEVLKAITGLEIPAFDAEFRRYLEKRLAHYKGTFQVRLAEYTDLPAREKVAAARPQDANAQADLALAYLAAEEPEKAGQAAARALRLEPRNKKGLYARAFVAYLDKDLATARTSLRELIAAGGEGYEARVRLGQIAIAAKDWKAAEAELTKAKKLDPERSEPYLLLSDVYTRQGKPDAAAAELERYVMIEQMEYAPVKKLVTRHLEARRWTKVKEYGEMAVLINPYDADVHMALAEAYLALGKPDDAIYEFDSALAVEPAMARPATAHLGLARAYLARKDGRKARKALERALKLEPKNADALALKKTIR